MPLANTGQAGMATTADTWSDVGVSQYTLGVTDSGIIVDCRGMGAKGDLRNLRGVRGEIVRLQAPEIELNHMLRLLHPRYPVYIVPRADGKLVVGATTIESEDRNNSSECRHFCHRERQNLQFS